MADAAAVVSIAMAEVGYREKATNASLDDPAANAGSGNWTKYARDLAAAGYYNGGKNGFAWCDVFVDWCFFKAFGAAEGQRVQCQTGPLGAACPYSAGYYKSQGRYDKNPRLGDQIFFQQGGSIVHTGIVVAVTGTAITTVEGNSSDQVARRTYSVGDSYIAGCGHPRYDETPAEPVTVALRPLAAGSTGPQVKTVQRILYSYGVRGADGKAIAVDGEFGPNTAHAVRLLQGKLGLAADGAVGADTWRSMLTELS